MIPANLAAHRSESIAQNEIFLLVSFQRRTQVRYLIFNGFCERLLSGIVILPCLSKDVQVLHPYPSGGGHSSCDTRDAGMAEASVHNSTTKRCSMHNK